MAKKAMALLILLALLVSLCPAALAAAPEGAEALPVATEEFTETAEIASAGANEKLEAPSGAKPEAKVEPVETLAEVPAEDTAKEETDAMEPAQSPEESALCETMTEVPEGWIGVYTKEDLFNVRCNPSGQYIQMADIEFTDTDFFDGGDFEGGWHPIGTINTPFTGFYNGNGFVICGLRGISSEDYQGLFGYASGTLLQNITLDDACITGGNYVGGIVGYVDNKANTVITGCVANVSIVASGDYVGGIAGCTYRSVVSRCTVSGSVEAKSYVGGIVGYFGNKWYAYSNTVLTLSQCRNTAQIQGVEMIGGLVGKISGEQYHTSPVYNLYENSVEIQDCYNDGNIMADTKCGGIVGTQANYSSLMRSYSVGYVVANSNFGGIVGSGDNASYCYYLTSGVSAPTNTIGTATSSGYFRLQGTYEQYDFTNVWTMTGDAEYPYAELRCFCPGGTISIVGDAIFDSTLTVDVSAAERLKGYTVAWYADDELVGFDEPFLIPAVAVAKTLTAVITSTDTIFRGSLTSEGVIVGKAVCMIAPKASEVLAKASDYIIISTENGQEYSLDCESWQDGARFSNLEPGTSYTVYTRVAETELYRASEIIEAVTVVTDRQGVSGSVRITGVAQFTRELGIDASLLWPPDATFDCEWRRGGVAVATGATYVPTAEDIGKQLTVLVTGTGQFIGSVESAPVTVEPCDIALASAELAGSFVYTRKPITPMLSLKNGALSLKRDTDYTLEYLNNVDVGSGTIRVSGVGNYQGTLDVPFTIEPKNLSQLNAAAIPDQNYCGEAVEPALSIYHDGEALAKDTDYTVTYRNNVSVGTASVTVTGVGNYTGTLTREFQIVRRSISGAVVRTELEEYAYTEQPITPEVTVTLDGKRLSPTTDFTVSYQNNLREGVATVTVTGKGGYKDSAQASFRISGHIYGDWVLEKSPNCTESGLQYKLCSGCGDRIEEVLPALGHDYQAQIVAPTLREKGYTRHTCSRCGDSYTDSYTDPLPGLASLTCCTVQITTGAAQNVTVCAAAYSPEGQFLEMKLIPIVQGQTEYSYAFERITEAAQIRVFYLDGTDTPLAEAQRFDHNVGQGHSYTETVLEAATCQKEGLKQYTCVYGDHSYTEVIPKTDHLPELLPAVAPDCTHSGLTEGSRCKFCGLTLQAQETVPATGHSWKAADCSHPKTCTVCGATEGAPSGEHSYLNGRCSSCGEKQPLTSLQIQGGSLTLSPGGTKTLSASYAPSSASAWTTYWYSDDPTVAKVSGSGVVTAVLPGSTTIHCVRGGKTASCTVTVSGNRGKSTYNYLCSYARTHAGSVSNGVYYYIEVLNSDLDSLSLIYDSSDRSLTIGHMNGDMTVSSMVLISEDLSTPYFGVFFYQPSSSTNWKGTASFSPSILGSGSYPSFLSWTGNSGSKASAEKIFGLGLEIALLYLEGGVLADQPNAVADLGFVNIAPYNAVAKPLSSLSLSKTALTLNKGQSAALTASTAPTGFSVTWYSSNDSVVSVSGGTVKALGSGTAVVYATAGGTLASCTVTVP